MDKLNLALIAIIVLFLNLSFVSALCLGQDGYYHECNCGASNSGCSGKVSSSYSGFGTRYSDEYYTYKPSYYLDAYSEGARPIYVYNMPSFSSSKKEEPSQTYTRPTYTTPSYTASAPAKTKSQMFNQNDNYMQSLSNYYNYGYGANNYPSRNYGPFYTSGYGYYPSYYSYYPYSYGLGYVGSLGYLGYLGSYGYYSPSYYDYGYTDYTPSYDYYDYGYSDSGYCYDCGYDYSGYDYSGYSDYGYSDYGYYDYGY